MKQYHQLGLTALMWAADKGHIEVVKMLLDRNANIETALTVSRNVSIACTALRIILIIIILIIILLLTIYNILLNYILISAIVIVHNA